MSDWLSPARTRACSSSAEASGDPRSRAALVGCSVSRIQSDGSSSSCSRSRASARGLARSPAEGSTSVTFAMLFVAGMPWAYVTGFVITSVMAITIAVLAAPYRMRRLFAFLDPFAQMTTDGYQIVQSYLAFRNGGIWGTGLGESKQKLYFFTTR